MRKLLSTALVAALAGCANLTPQQQANLQLELSAGEVAVKGVGTVYCIMEPVTGQIIRAFDTSNNTAINLAKLDTATAIACQAAIKAGAITATGA